MSVEKYAPRLGPELGTSMTTALTICLTIETFGKLAKCQSCLIHILESSLVRLSKIRIFQGFEFGAKKKCSKNCNIYLAYFCKKKKKIISVTIFMPK